MITQHEVGTLQRHFRAKALARRPGSIVQLDAGLYRVESQYRPGCWYVVNLADKTCTCPDFQRRGWPCKHGLAGQEADKASKRRKVVIDDWDMQTGQVYAWHYDGEPTPADYEAERQRKIERFAKARDELFPR